MNRGLFVVFEGIDGTGKTTQADLLAAELSRRGYGVLLTRDPGGTALGEGLRNVLLYGAGSMDHGAEAMLYAAARAQLVAEKILPALAGGLVVISDRFADSTLSYQGAGRGVDGDFLRVLNRQACRGLVPDLTVLLDMDPAGAMSRLNRPADRMEREGPDFLRRVKNGYLALAGEVPGRYLVLDASLAVDWLSGRVLADVEKRLATLEIRAWKQGGRR